MIDHRLAERGRIFSVEERVAAARRVAQILAPLGQDKWEQHIAHIAERLTSQRPPCTRWLAKPRSLAVMSRGDRWGMTDSRTSTAASSCPYCVEMGSDTGSDR